MKKAGNGLSINGTTYKTVEDLEKPSLEVCDDAVKILVQHGMASVEEYEKAFDTAIEEIEKTTNVKNIREKYKGEIEGKIKEVRSELSKNIIEMWKMETNFAKGSWKVFKNRKEKPNPKDKSNSDKKKLNIKNRGRSKSMDFFEKACKNPEKVLDYFEEDSARYDCASRESIKILTVLSEQLNDYIDNSDKTLAKYISKIEPFLKDLISKETDDNHNNNEEEETSKPKNIITPKKSNNGPAKKNSTSSQEDFMSELQEKVKNRKKIKNK